MGLDLRNRLVSALGLVIPATLLWTYPTIHTLSGHLADQLGSPEQTTVPATEPADEAAEAYAGLGDDEKTQLLAEGIVAFEQLLEKVSANFAA